MIFKRTLVLLLPGVLLATTITCDPSSTIRLVVPAYDTVVIEEEVYYDDYYYEDPGFGFDFFYFD